jgi:hypothetical protein
MSETRSARTPWHLWLAGILGSLWSAMGAVSFLLTQMNVEAVMSQFPPEQREYFHSFPLWADASWAISVSAGLAGCLLLLLRDRRAFPLLLTSAVGVAVTNLGGLMLLGGMDVMRRTDGLGATVLPIVIGAFLAFYARAMATKGVLR